MSNMNPLRYIAVAACLLLATPAAFADDDCQSVSKEVSIDGGSTWYRADSQASAPTQVVGLGVSYRFVIRNCSETNVWTNILITDQTLGMRNVSVLDSDGQPLVLQPMSEEFVIDEYSTGFSKLNQPDICDTAGFKVNRVKLKVDDGTGDKVHFYDHGCVICEEPSEELAELGDRVWEDLDIDGIQDCEDTNGNGIIGDAGDEGIECGTGIPNLPVNLLAGDCSTPLGQTVMTDPDGFYLFPNLQPGDYCVEFVPPGDDFCVTDGYDLGAPQFTLQNEGINNAIDSDADETTGISDPVNLSGGESNRTVDAGVYCPAKVGDFVWLDENGDGMQDSNEIGVEGVAVHLWNCGEDGVSGTDDDYEMDQTRFTDSNGLYMFGAEPGVYDLQPDNYFVQFVQPEGYEFTIPGVGGDDIDSDCRVPRGKTACTGELQSRMINLKRDCGLIPPPTECALSLDKTCKIPATPPPPPSEGKCDGRLQQFTVIWTGDTINVSGPDNDAPGGVVNANQAVTFFGPFDDNDVYVSLSGAASGESVFHMSCSDDDFNTPDDCGKAAGDGKNGGKGKKGKKGDDDDADLINDWLVEGWIDDSGAALMCSGGDDDGDDEFPMLDSCQTSLVGADCDTLGKPKKLTFRYTGGTCPGANTQGSKTECDDFGTLPNTVQIVATGKDADKLVIEPDGFVTMGTSDDTITISKSDGKDLKAETELEILDELGNKLQYVNIHTSCSAALAAGDVFGGLTLSMFGDNAGGSEVIYGYSVTNNGDALTGVNLTDDKLGAIAGPFDLAAGETAQFTVATSLLGTTTNVATATTTLLDGTVCLASDSVTVEFTEPEPPVGSCDDDKPKTLIFEYTGEDCSMSSNDQGNKASCSGDLNGQAPVMIEYVGKNAGKIGIFPETETINIGDMVTLDAFDKDKLKSNTEIEITQGGVVLQEIELHTSCSKPLEVDDQFGSLVLKTFIPKD